MAMRLIYTPQFQKRFDEIMSCGHEFYGKQFLKKLFKEIKNLKNLLIDNPYIGSKEELLESLDGDFRRIVLQKHIKIIYFVKNDSIFLTDIWDTRRNPETLVDGITNW